MSRFRSYASTREAIASLYFFQYISRCVRGHGNVLQFDPPRNNTPKVSDSRATTHNVLGNIISEPGKLMPCEAVTIDIFRKLTRIVITHGLTATIPGVNGIFAALVSAL